MPLIRDFSQLKLPAKRDEHPERWSKEERNWQPIGAVELNPEQHKEAA